MAVVTRSSIPEENPEGSQMADEAAFALEGFRVVDLSQMLAAPGAAMYLADQRADVIKVEPLWGDQARQTLTDAPMGSSESRSFLAQNRNKRDIALDLRHSSGREVLLRLVERADVLIHNFRRGVAERLGCDYPTLRQQNKRLVYGWLTGYGTEGPYADQPGYDYLLQALMAMDVPCTPVLEWPEVFDHAQMLANGLFYEYEHPSAGRTRLVAPAVRLEPAPAPLQRPAPLLGQHTREILGELGYSDAATAAFEEEGVVNK